MGRTARKERETARTRADIIEAAARAFARKGSQRTTMEDIAAESGFAVGSLYNYFDGKSDIYLSLLETISTEFEQLFDDPLIASLAFPERLHWLIVRQFELVERRRALFATLVAERNRSAAFEEPQTEGDRLVRDGKQRCFERLTAALQQGQQSGALRADLSTTELAHFVTGAIDAAMVRWLAEDQDQPPSEQCAALVDLLLRGVGEHGDTPRSTRGRNRRGRR